MNLQHTAVTAERWHEIDMGHTVTGHGGKCANLHGHRYRFHFKVAADNERLDKLGMVVDFGVIKSTLCQWLDDTWDHKFMVWRKDERALKLNALNRNGSVIIADFNPTAENIAAHFLQNIAPGLLPDGYTLTELVVNETNKCSARAKLVSNGVASRATITNERVSRMRKQVQEEADKLAAINKRAKKAKPAITFHDEEVGVEADDTMRYCPEPPAAKKERFVGSPNIVTGIGRMGEFTEIETEAFRHKPKDHRFTAARADVVNILRAIEPNGLQLRQGLIETPDRVVKAYSHLYGGYDVDVAALLKTFEDGAQGVDEMVIVKNIPFYSNCEHHMLPFFGTATVAYIPNGKIVGLSKINRVVDAFARRLQVQERLTQQIAGALQEHLKPLGVAVRLEARHLCMESRGVQQSGHTTVTTTLLGAFKTSADTRAEFLQEVN